MAGFLQEVTKGMFKLVYPESVSVQTFQDATVVDNPVSDEVIGTGDGSTVTFSATLANHPVKAGSVVVKYVIGGSNLVAADDGSGAISGSNITSGTIDYSTGAISLTFDTAPDNSTNITCDYIYESNFPKLIQKEISVNLPLGRVYDKETIVYFMKYVKGDEDKVTVYILTRPSKDIEEWFVVAHDEYNADAEGMVSVEVPAIDQDAKIIVEWSGTSDIVTMGGVVFAYQTM